MTGNASHALTPVLRAENICKTYVDEQDRHVNALQDVSVDVRAHEFVSIIGPSGCGKSTFLRIVAGLDRPTSGQILVNGQRADKPGPDRGMVFQEYALFPWKTVLENVIFGPMLKGRSRAECLEIGRTLINMVGLEGSDEKYPHQLSGGMRQRAAVARALANRPAILLMDEPFAAVDAITRQSLQEEIVRLSSEHRITVLFVTHSIDEAVFLSDRVIVLSKHPGTVREEINIDLERPRAWNTVSKAAGFQQARERLLALMQTH